MASLDRKWVAVCLLYLFGAFHWLLFMQWGDRDFTALDWKYVHQWVAIVKLALENGQMPYHVAYYSEEIAAGNFIFGDRYFALPFLIASPQILAVSFLSIENWMTLQLILVYTVGFWGLVQWIRKLELSVFASVFVIILFSFNGFHSSRIGVGHLQNISYFLIPWVLWIVNNLLEARSSTIQHKLLISLQFAFLVFFTLLQGSSQLIPNMALVGLCVLLFYPKQIAWYVLGGSIGVILSSHIVWPVLFFSPYSSATDRIVFGGYGVNSPPLYYNVYRWFTHLYTASNGSWESEAYVSLLGVLLIIGGCVALLLKKSSSVTIPLLSIRFLLGMGIVVLLSLDNVYGRLWSLLQHIHPLPAIDRVPTRLIIYPLTYVILVSSLGFDRLFEIVKNEKIRSALKWLSLIVLLALLMEHSWLWSLSNTVRHWPYATDNRGGFTFGERILNRGGDDLYIMTVHFSYFVSFVTAVCAGIGYIFLRRKVSLAT